MILIETKVNGSSIVAKIREHSPLANCVASTDLINKARPHGRYRKLSLSEHGKFAISADGSVARLSKIGAASGALDGANLQIHRVDVGDEYRGRGFGLALTQALLQAAIKNGVQLGGDAFLIADEGETAGLRIYYGKMGFVPGPDYGATDTEVQYPMKARVDVAIGNLQIWRAAKHSQDPTHLVLFS